VVAVAVTVTQKQYLSAGQVKVIAMEGVATSGGFLKK